MAGQDPVQLPAGWVAGDRGTCRSCQAPVVWAIHERTGKRSPFDLDRRDAEGRLVNHFAVCPDAGTWRRKR